jgi:hypothetical protein
VDAKQKKSLVVGSITLVVLIGVIIGAVHGGRTLWGSDVGGKCDEDFDCKPGSICISRRCRRSCKVDADCQSGWMCRGTEVSITKGGDARNGFKLDTVNICFSPEAMAPQLARERMEKAAEDERALERRIRDKRFQVQLAAITKLTLKPPLLTDAEFDGAWAKIPAPEQATASVDALADRVIALARAK